MKGNQKKNKKEKMGETFFEREKMKLVNAKKACVYSPQIKKGRISSLPDRSQALIVIIKIGKRNESNDVHNILRKIITVPKAL